MIAKKQRTVKKTRSTSHKEKEQANQPVVVTKTQKVRLQQIGKMGDSYSSVIENLLNYWNNTAEEPLIAKKQLPTQDKEKKIEKMNFPNAWNVKKTWPPEFQEEKEEQEKKELANLIITLTKIQKEKLKQIGKMGDSYSSVIDRLLDYWEETHDKYVEGKLRG